MISVKEIQISSQYSVDFIYGKIVLEDTREDISEYRFNLYRSNNADDGYIAIKSDLNDFTFQDYGVNLRNISIHYYYKVEIIHKASGKANWSEPVHFQAVEQDAIAFYLNEVYRTQMEYVVGNRKMILLSRKHEGQLCNSCYDPIRKRSQSVSCPVCYNTTYVGGYYKPVVINMVLMNAAANTQEFSVDAVGEKKTPITMWTANYPLIQIDDILVDIHNNRYIVMGWQPSYKNEYLIRQTIQVGMVEKSSVVYNIPVDANALKV
jgi:ribosomal protein L37AE/L43A